MRMSTTLTISSRPSSKRLAYNRLTLSGRNFMCDSLYYQEFLLKTTLKREKMRIRSFFDIKLMTTVSLRPEG